MKIVSEEELNRLYNIDLDVRGEESGSVQAYLRHHGYVSREEFVKYRVDSWENSGDEYLKSLIALHNKACMDFYRAADKEKEIIRELSERLNEYN